MFLAGRVSGAAGFEQRAVGWLSTGGLGRHSSTGAVLVPESVGVGSYIECVFEYGGRDAEGVLNVAADVHRSLVEHECRILELAAEWADCHPGEVAGRRAGIACDIAREFGGDGTPSVAWSCVAELGTVLQTTTGAAESLIGDALDLRHRLPRLWQVVVGAGVRAWKARKVAQATRHLSLAAAAAVDAAVASTITSVPWARFERLLEAAIMTADPADAEARAHAYEAERFVRAGRSVAGLKTLVARASAGEVIWFVAMVNRIAEILAADGDLDSADVRRSKAIGILANPAHALELLAAHAGNGVGEPGGVALDPADPDVPHRSISVDPPTIDPRRLQPTVVLHVHLSSQALRTGDGIARVEDVGPVTLGQVRRFLGSVGCRIRLLPTLDASGMPAVDRYEVPAAMREALLNRNPADVFPWGVCTSRRMDLDHTDPYRDPARGGPPGQTSLNNLGPLVRSHHRYKTFAGWRLRQPEPGTYLWRSPHGWYYLVNATGTHDLGNGVLAHALWDSVRAGTKAYTPAA